MLAAANRMRRAGDFTVTMRKGRRGAGGTLVVHVSKDPAGEEPLVGFAVSKAVGGAVVRNRVQRRLRHLMRERVRELPDGTRVVVRALPAAATATYQELGTDLSHVLKTAMEKVGRQ